MTIDITEKLLGPWSALLALWSEEIVLKTIIAWLRNVGVQLC